MKILFNLSHSISKSNLILLALPCPMIEAVGGSPARHV
jgi:hypothetical protein